MAGDEKLPEEVRRKLEQARRESLADLGQVDEVDDVELDRIAGGVVGQDANWQVDAGNVAPLSRPQRVKREP